MIWISTLERCFVKDKDMVGPSFKSEKLPNPEECQKLCQRTKECEMFVYATTTFNSKGSFSSRPGYCHLKEGISIPSFKTAYGVIAGPKFCHNDGGNISKLNLLKY